jgi:hypothetical protein
MGGEEEKVGKSIEGEWEGVGGRKKVRAGSNLAKTDVS